ncbi:hypothetical protein ACWGB8_38620 [Kitasatospora sp. NPDC054939]
MRPRRSSSTGILRRFRPDGSSGRGRSPRPNRQDRQARPTRPPRPHHPPRRGRLHRLAAALGLAAAAVLLGAAPAAAHGDTITLEIPGQDNGHVTTVATWDNDRDPVTEEFAGTLSAASSDGRTAGPWRLVPITGRPGAYTTREILPAGHWKVTVVCAFPTLGRGERELDVEPAVITDPPMQGPPATGPTATGPTAAPRPSGAPTGSGTATGTGTATATATATVGGPSGAPVVAAPTGGTAVTTARDAGNTATWAALATAAAAVLLLAVGLRLRRRNRG